MLKDVVVSLKMFFMPAFASKLRSEAALGLLSDEIEWCDHHEMNVAVVMRLLSRITSEDHKIRARALLAGSTNLTCKEYAIHLDPSYARVCADAVMQTVRRHLKEHGHQHDRASFVHQLLLKAAKWYALVGALTPALAAEIQAGLRKTEWVHRY